MTDSPDGTGEDRHRCEDPICDADAAFLLYDREAERWRPICERHALAVHPSIEIRAWLESGYLRPAELERPRGPPPEPSGDRAAAFREAVDEAMGWSD